MAELKDPQHSSEEFRCAFRGFFIRWSIHSKPWHAGKHMQLQMVQTLSISEIVQYMKSFFLRAKLHLTYSNLKTVHLEDIITAKIDL